MSSDIVLTSALRSNLLSLQNTQSLIDETQLRLATGLKVNSALDNPQNFFAAQSLNNRAGDLSRLLDGISQSIRTIEGANQGITALTTLVNQADSIATSALEALSDGEQVASVTGATDLRNIEDLGADIANIDDSDVLTFAFTDEDGDAVTITNNTVTIADGDNIDDVLNKLNGLRDDDGDKVLTAELTSEGFLKLSAVQGGQFEIDASTGGTDLLSGLGLGGLDANAFSDAVTVDETKITVNNTTNIESQAFYAADGEIAEASTLLSATEDINGTGYTFVGTAGEEDDVVFSVNGGTLVDLGQIGDLTIQGFVDAINTDDSVNTLVRAQYDETTGRISIASLSDTVESIQIGARDTDNDGTTGATVDFGFGIADSLAASDAATANVTIESIKFSSAAGNLEQFEADFNKVRDQIDSLVADTSYRGVNLLNGDDLVTTFNEDRTSQLTTEGVTFTSSGLGISEASFGIAVNVESALSDVRGALEAVRNFGQSISNDLTIIQTRENFTNQTINTLESGADDLTIADQNEEGANLLALQTAQALGTTALSLASQSAQSVLRLF